MINYIRDDHKINFSDFKEFLSELLWAGTMKRGGGGNKGEETLSQEKHVSNALFENEVFL